MVAIAFILNAVWKFVFFRMSETGWLSVCVTEMIENC